MIHELITTFFPLTEVITIYYLKRAGMWNFSKKLLNTLATISGLSSWITCPTLSTTTSLNLPCMCAMVNSLSILSFPASKSCFGTLNSRKVLVRSLNHSVQYYLLPRRSVRHTKTFWPESASIYSTTWAGMDTLAE